MGGGVSLHLVQKLQNARIAFAGRARLLEDLTTLQVLATQVPLDIGEIRLRIVLQQVRIGPASRRDR